MEFLIFDCKRMKVGIDIVVIDIGIDNVVGLKGSHNISGCECIDKNVALKGH